MLDERQQFKFGFLLEAGRRGLDLDAVESLLEKNAAGISDWIPGYDLVAHVIRRGVDTGLDVGGHVAKTLGNAGMIGLAGAPLVAGAALGVGSAHLRGMGGDESVGEEKQRELISAYDDARKRVEANRAARKRRESQGGPRRPRYAL